MALAVALLAMRFNSLADAVMLLSAVVTAPLAATLLSGVFWRRTTGSGAFAGLIAGAIAAVIHHGLVLPAGEQRGMHGGWIAVLHHPASELQLSLGNVLIAFSVALMVTVVVSLLTRPHSESRLAELMKAVADASIKMDLRIPLGMMFTLIGTVLAAFGMSTRDNPDLYRKSLGIDMNVWWGFPLLFFGVLMLALGRRGQAKMEKQGTRDPANKGTGNRKRKD
jgi:hypothetical protein